MCVYIVCVTSLFWIVYKQWVSQISYVKVCTSRVHSTKYILYVIIVLNTQYSKIIKKYLEVLQFLKPKEKILINFYFLLYLLWIVQVSRQLLSSQWKPPSFLVETVTLKSSHFGKRPYAWNQIRTTFSGPSVSKILRVGSQGPPGHWYCTSFTQSLKWMGLKSLFYRKIWGHTLYDKQLGTWISHYLVGCTL